MKRGEEYLLVDLVDRGVKLIPSATSQLAARSKTLQARLFADLMVPHTIAIYNQHDLLEASCLYRREKIEKVVVKHDRKNSGLGIHLFRDIEDVYTLMANDGIAPPFVIQPLLQNASDIRVIIVGDYIEAYLRSNPDSFRNNLHWGGTSQQLQLDDTQLSICSKAMSRGQFPYAHIDLLTTEDKKNYLSEINLTGGIKGAAISTTELKKRRREVEEKLLDTHFSESSR